jgi:hypothetical protein
VEGRTVTVPTHVRDLVERRLLSVTEAEARLIALQILVCPLPCPPASDADVELEAAEAGR